MYRANVLFRQFEPQGPADRVLCYLTIYIGECIRYGQRNILSRNSFTLFITGLVLLSNCSVIGYFCDRRFDILFHKQFCRVIMKIRLTCYIHGIFMLPAESSPSFRKTRSLAKKKSQHSQWEILHYPVRKLLVLVDFLLSPKIVRRVVHSFLCKFFVRMEYSQLYELIFPFYRFVSWVLPSTA